MQRCEGFTQQIISIFLKPLLDGATMTIPINTRCHCEIACKLEIVHYLIGIYIFYFSNCTLFNIEKFFSCATRYHTHLNHERVTS